MAGPKWWASKQAYFAYIDHKRVRLGTDLLEATRRFHELSLASLSVTHQFNPTVLEVVAAYLARLTLRNPPKTLKAVKELMTPFTKALGNVKARDLTEAQVTLWLASKPTWGPGTRGRFTSALRTAYRRAQLPPPDLGRREHGPGRGAECLVSDEQHAALISVANPAFADFLVALEQTGARPGYVRTVKVSEFQGDMWVMPPEPGRKVKKQVVILLSETMIAMSQRLAAKNSTGPLFRDRRGKPWTEPNLYAHWYFYKKKVGLPEPIDMYSYRHRFATRWLEKGGSPAYLAEIQATSLNMIEKFYCHLSVESIRREHHRVLRFDNPMKMT